LGIGLFAAAAGHTWWPSHRDGGWRPRCSG